MPYIPNTTRWSPGDLVIHSADAKRPDMLMRVIGYDDADMCQTEYVDQSDPGRAVFGRGRNSTLFNKIDHLLDPKDFNIATQGDISVTHSDFFTGLGGATTWPPETSGQEPILFVPPPEPHGLLDKLSWPKKPMCNTFRLVFANQTELTVSTTLTYAQMITLLRQRDAYDVRRVDGPPVSVQFAHVLYIEELPEVQP